MRAAIRVSIVVLWLVWAATAQAVRVEDIPSPRPQGWVSDQAQILDAQAEAEINRLAEKLHQRSGAELAVVTLRSTDGEDPRRLATRLFNHWGIGSAQRDDGVLIFVAIEDRAAELILGDGIDDDAQVARSDAIMQQRMLPLFRQGDPQGAIIAGAQATVRDLFPVDPSQSVDPTQLQVESEAASAEVPMQPIAEPQTERRTGVMDSLPTPSPALTFSAAGGGALGLWWAIRRWWRNRPRRCRACNGMMERLAESADDAHLSQAERVEEKIGSVDYDVWACPHCGEVEKLRYGAWLTKYARCPQCKAKTKSSTEHTLQRATYSSGGLVRVDERCEHCNFRNSFRRSTPRLQRSSSGSRSRSGFSGGSSSGRGSSGRW